MMKIYTILLVISATFLSGCISYSDNPTYQKRQSFGAYDQYCMQETVVAIQDAQGYMEVPACMEYSYDVNTMPAPTYEVATNNTVFSLPPAEAPEIVPVAEAQVAQLPQPEPQIEEIAEPAPTLPPVPLTKLLKKQIRTTRIITPQYEQEYNPDDVEGDFPEVDRNKYVSEIVLENQNTHVLAFCRGTEEEAEKCATRLENHSSCYVRVSDIPYVAAKYDTLKTGTYPTRRWREGDLVPRW